VPTATEGAGILVDERILEYQQQSIDLLRETFDLRLEEEEIINA